MAKGDEGDVVLRVTDIAALKSNTEMAVDGFTERWLPMPSFTIECEVMDVRQLRDAMGLRATIEAGDPWPYAEQLLLQRGFRWHWLGTARVMYLRERGDYAGTSAGGGDGWIDAEELEEKD